MLGSREVLQDTSGSTVQPMVLKRVRAIPIHYFGVSKTGAKSVFSLKRSGDSSVQRTAKAVDCLDLAPNPSRNGHF
jgi:hypothetical protein